MDHAPDALLALGLALITAGAFVTLGLGAALITAGVALLALGVIYARAGA